MKELIFKFIIIIFVFTNFTTLTFAQSSNLGRSDKARFQMADKSARTVLKQFMKEIKNKEKRLEQVLNESAPERVKERYRVDLQSCIAQYNAFAADAGLESYESKLLNLSSNDSPQQKSSKLNDEIIVLTVSSDGSTKDEAIKTLFA